MTTIIIEGIVKVLSEAVPKILEIWSLKDKPYLSDAQIRQEIVRIQTTQKGYEERENALATAKESPP